MGTYNPYIPYILGQEWCPIRNEHHTLTPAKNALEKGHTFTLATSRMVQQGRFYLTDAPTPPTDPNNQVVMMGIYPTGREHLSGPVRSVVIPVNSGLVTGMQFVPSTSTIADILLSPDDGKYLLGTAIASNDITIDLKFAVNQYVQLLMGKRILGVDFLYTANAGNAIIGDTTTFPPMIVGLSTSFPSTSQVDMGVMEVIEGNQADITEIGRIGLGEIDWYWQNSGTGRDQMPWTPTRLLAFDSGFSTSRKVRITTDFGQLWGVNQSFLMYYGALEVFFCEENRVAVGGAAFIASTAKSLVQNTNAITLRTMADAINPTLAAGTYTAYVSSANQANQADLFSGVGVFPPVSASQPPVLNALRELYNIPSHTGVDVNIPFPMDSTAVGDVFTREETHILPQLSLSTTGGPLTEVHVYGRQARAQVYGTVIATQELADAAVPAGTAFRWSRFYARRFGETTVPLELFKTSGGDNNNISVAEFDALPEILDGWKQVDLYWDSPVTMGGGTNPRWEWIATNELIGNRWEVLGGYAPALSGTPGNLLTLTPSPHQLSIATYGQPASGAAINLGWVPGYAPPVSATTDDQTADAFLIFAQEMPLVTGFGVEVLNQVVSGIGQDCGLDPCCIPTQIQYNHLDWSLPVRTGVALDSFDRVEVASWGNADQGGAYTEVGTAADYSVNGEGSITFSANNSSRFATLNIGAVDFDITAPIIFQDQIASGSIRGGLVGRFTSASDNYLASLDVSTTGVVTIQIEERVGGVPTTLATATAFDLVGGPGAPINLRFMVSGSLLKAKAWRYGDPEPDGWNLEATDTSLTTGNEAGVFARDNSAVTGHRVTFLSLSITPPQYWFGYYELQRMDTVETDWQTIMQATSPALTEFNDYEARVGILTSYQIRMVDSYGFPGPWSATVTATIPAPGVTIGCDDGHLLIFTSNEHQDGSINLAYSSVWEGRVEEDFAFSEAGFVQLQAMYNRDFYTAFRPMERGGEQFQRTVLVQAAAIAPETLGDFTSLRDMAWDDVSYICVRDEDGNRWFSAVLVPSGRVLRNRKLYMAPVQIVEVTATPSPVDPSA